jgi:hypothetical protein
MENVQFRKHIECKMSFLYSEAKSFSHTRVQYIIIINMQLADTFMIYSAVLCVWKLLDHLWENVPDGNTSFYAQFSIRDRLSPLF